MHAAVRLAAESSCVTAELLQETTGYTVERQSHPAVNIMHLLCECVPLNYVKYLTKYVLREE